jgi:hypothetical protein
MDTRQQTTFCEDHVLDDETGRWLPLATWQNRADRRELAEVLSARPNRFRINLQSRLMRAVLVIGALLVSITVLQGREQ